MVLKPGYTCSFWLNGLRAKLWTLCLQSFPGDSTSHENHRSTESNRWCLSPLPTLMLQFLDHPAVSWSACLWIGLGQGSPNWAPYYRISAGHQTSDIPLLPTEPIFPSQGLRSAVSTLISLNSQNPRTWDHLIYFPSEAADLTPSLGDGNFNGSKVISSPRETLPVTPRCQPLYF